MKIEVNQSHTEPWGRLSIAETKLAAERLSGNSFKAWVQLALNQDGYIWCGDLEPRTVQELTDYSYLLPLANGNYLFRPDGEPGDSDTPAEWEKIAELYGSSGQQDLSWVRDKLKSAYLDDRTEDILSYWAEKYHSLQEIDHSKARNRLRYDFSVVLVWWLWGNFRFQVGDVLEFGQDAKLLRYHDAMFKATINVGTDATIGRWLRLKGDGDMVGIVFDGDTIGDGPGLWSQKPSDGTHEFLTLTAQKLNIIGSGLPTSDVSINTPKLDLSKVGSIEWGNNKPTAYFA